MTLDDLLTAAAAEGLCFRGGFAVTAADSVPALAPDRPAQTLLLLGSVGGSLWSAFSQPAEFHDGLPDPLDRWSQRVIGGLAERFSALALFPFGGPPYQPFLRWARRAEGVAPSPLGMQIHATHGLWHAYRGALALAETLDLPAPEPSARPCDSCADRPCLTACPVGAFTLDGSGATGYNLQGCARHVGSPAGAACLEKGCLARRACPIGADLVYAPPQANFHMRAFLAARQRERT